MVTPDKGDFPRSPANAAGRKIAEAWDPAKDQASGNECKPMVRPASCACRAPAYHLADDDTLRVETDAGIQTRLLHFYGTASAERPLQAGKDIPWLIGRGCDRGGRWSAVAQGAPGRGSAGRRRVYEGDHHAPSPGIHSQEWRAIQRQCKR